MEAVDDGKTWTFHIRDDATWQDGVPVTAADVLYTVGALKDPAASGGRSSSWAEVEATAVDDKTVDLPARRRPVGSFLAAAAQPLLPSHLLKDVPYADIATSDFSRLPVGSGPFGITELDGAHAVLVPAQQLVPPGPTASPTAEASIDSLATPIPRPSVTGLTPFIERIELSFFSDDDAAAAALAAGEIDAVAGLAPEQASRAAARPACRASVPDDDALDDHAQPPPEPPGASRRPRPQGAPGRDRPGGARARRPRRRRHRGRHARAADLVGVRRQGGRRRPIRRTAAASLLKAAGWTKVDGAWAKPHAKVPYELELLSVPATANPRLASIAAAVRDAWTKLGFKVTLVEKPAAALAADLRGGTFTASVLDIMMGLEPDLFPLLASCQVRARRAQPHRASRTPSWTRSWRPRASPATAADRVAAWKALLAGIAARAAHAAARLGRGIDVHRGVEGVTPTLISDTGDRFWDVLAWRLAADR